MGHLDSFWNDHFSTHPPTHQTFIYNNNKISCVNALAYLCMFYTHQEIICQMAWGHACKTLRAKVNLENLSLNLHTYYPKKKNIEAKKWTFSKEDIARGRKRGIQESCDMHMNSWMKYFRTLHDISKCNKPMKKFSLLYFLTTEFQGRSKKNWIAQFLVLAKK